MVAIRARAPESNNGIDPTASTKVAAGTKVGLILGTLCLFFIITAYQLFIPRKPKPPSQYHTLFPPRPKKPTLLHRLRTSVVAFLRFFKRGEKPSPEGTNHTERHGRLRSLYLPGERQRKRERIREKFSTTLRLNLHPPHIPKNPFHKSAFSSKPSRHYAVYARLHDEDGETNTPTKPPSAMISPWSANEEDFPLLSPFHSPLYITEELVTPPSLYPPPSVYVPETPLRGGNNDTMGTPSIGFRDTSAQDVSPESLIDVVSSMIKERDEFSSTKQDNADPFIIAEEDEWDCGTIESDYSNHG